MGWYDLFARFYDRSLEPLYVQSRAAAVEALQLRGQTRLIDRGAPIAARYHRTA